MRPGRFCRSLVLFLAIGASAPAHAADTDRTETAANALLALVKQSMADPTLPVFARERIAWVINARRTGSLSLVLLRHTETAGLAPEALMASGRVNGRAVIVIARPRFESLLAEGREPGQTFSRRQRNDFLLALVHETVHLERNHSAPAASLEDRLCEEERAWRAVDMHVVRQLLEHHEPMNPRFIEADRAIRSCGDKEPCQALRRLLADSEISR